MLVKIRDRHIKRIMWGLVILIVPSFVIWGGVSYINEKRVRVVGQIGKKNINVSDFAYYYEMARTHNLLASKTDEYHFDNKEIEKQAWQYALLMWKIKKDRVNVSDREIVTFIKQMLFGKNAFNEQIYTRFLRYHLHIEAKIFEEYCRNFIAIDALFAKYVSTKINDEEIKDAYLKDTHTAAIGYLTIPYEKFKVTANEKEAKDFFTANTQIFAKGPMVKFKYILIDKNNKELLKKVDAQIKTLKSLDKIASTCAIKMKETKLLNLNEAIDGVGLAPTVNSTAYSLPDALPSKLFAVNNEMISVQKIDMRENYIPAFDQIKEKVIIEASRNKAKKSAIKYAKKLINKIKQKTSLNISDLASRETITYKQVQSIKYYDPIGDIGINEAISKMIFSVNSNGVIENPAQDSTGVYVLLVENISPIDEKDFTAKKDAYRARLYTQKETVGRIGFLSRLAQDTSMKIYQLKEQE